MQYRLHQKFLCIPLLLQGLRAAILPFFRHAIARRHLWLFCFLISLVTAPHRTFARDWLQPFPSEKSPFVAETFQYVPYRFVYGGFVAEQPHVRYLLKGEDGRIRSMHLGETVDDVTPIGADPSRSTLTVQDHALNRTLTLTLGEEAILTDRFTGMLVYKERHYPFSQQPLRLNEQMQLTPMLHEDNWYLIEQTQGEEPRIWQLPIL